MFTIVTVDAFLHLNTNYAYYEYVQLTTFYVRIPIRRSRYCTE